MPFDPDRQQQTLHAYLALTSSRSTWRGCLVFLPASRATAPVATAAVIAGAAVLWIDSAFDSLREAANAGVVDFSVTSLSEAIRILKNELRKGSAVSVGVLDTNGTVWKEAVDRGLQPEALLAASAPPIAVDTFLQRGASLLSVTHEVAATHLDSAANWRDRQARDRALIAGVAYLPEPQRTVAERWYMGAARLFPRDLLRCDAACWHASNHTA